MNAQLSQQTAHFIIGMKIIEVGTDYIKLENGYKIHLQELNIIDLNFLVDLNRAIKKITK